MRQPEFNVALIIPTGIGASIGGFGGDAMTLLPLLGAVCDTVITHPNVANAACFQALPKNALYVEGYALDQFFLGNLGLQPTRQNRVGIIWDSGISEEMRVLHQNTIAAVQTVYGVTVCGIRDTTAPVDLKLILAASGRSTGKIGNPTILLEAAAALVKQGATALAVCCLMPEVEANQAGHESAYRAGQGVDPIAGLEAMISHYLVSELGLPAAHAPVFSYEDALPVTDRQLDPRAASEFIVPTFLPCVLTGLARAPQSVPIHPGSSPANPTGLTVHDLSALLVPADALGCVPVLSAIERNIPVLAILNNHTVMQATPNRLGLDGKVTLCANYREALGHLVALREGIRLPAHF